MPLIAKAKRHDGMGSALHSRAPRKLAGRWQLPPHPFYRTQPVKSAAYNERLGPRVAGGGSCHRGNTKGTRPFVRSEEHTSELQSLMRISYAVFCLKKKKDRHHQARTDENTSELLSTNHQSSADFTLNKI